MQEIWQIGEPIEAPFDTKGYTFYKGGRGIAGTPLERYLHLVAVKGDDRVEITRVAELHGRVVIRKRDEALAFVRLFTALDTHYLFTDLDYIEPRLAAGEPGVGEYTEQYRRRMRLRRPLVRKPDDSYMIERNLLNRSGALFRGTERVSRDGAYALLTSEIIVDHSPITFPLYQ